MMIKNKVTRRFELREFPLAVLRMDKQGELDLHSHSFSELVIVTGGRGVHFTESESYPIQSGDVFAIELEEGHGYGQTDELRIVNLIYFLERLQLPVEDLRVLPGFHALFSLEPKYRKQHNFASRLHLDAGQLAIVSGLLDTLEDELDKRAPGYEFMCKANFMQLVCQLSRWYAEMKIKAARPLIRLGSVISHMEAHYAKQLVLQDLADMAHMSVSTFLRAFREATGVTPIDYIIRQRIIHASEILCRTDLSVTEAAFEVGFSDSNYFSRQFRKIVGMSPSSFRKRAALGRSSGV